MRLGHLMILRLALVTPTTSHVLLPDIVSVGDYLFRLGFVVWRPPANVSKFISSR